MGGCVSSSHSNDDDDAAKIAAQQRRRLSVAPTQVGDINGQVHNGPASPVKSPATATNPAVDGDVKISSATSLLSPIQLLAKGTVSVAAHSRKGLVPYNRNKVNQDRLICEFGLGGEISVCVFGVMDGHGEFGHLVAQFVSETLPKCLEQNIELIKTNTTEAILKSVQALCTQLTETNINVAFSGTTCVFGVKVDKKLYVANIGDSRCILCRQTSTGELQALSLSIDQKPELPEEKQRILAAGGRVEPLPGPPGEDCGPPRVWLAEVDVPGLAMSRSIGDEVSQTVGVISIPEIIVHEILSNDIFAVFASDGVWEFLSSQQVCSLVWRYQHDMSVAAEQLIDESVKQWKKEEDVIDDITCVIIKLNDPVPAQ